MSEELELTVPEVYDILYGDLDAELEELLEELGSP